ncbi:MAG: glycoside hydrolase family 5 protein [Ruminococcus sp.]|nr:glycoside hydrolase family 5 protein [Ruminococcus sp.]
MKSDIKFAALFGAVLFAVSVTGCSSGSNNNTQTSESETPKNNGTFTMSAENIAETLGAGWNYGNTLEANSNGHPSETVWGNPKASQEMVNAVADAGFSTIRVPVSYLDYIDDDNNYKVDETWLNRVQEVVDYCYNRELNVIINVHGDGYNTISGGWFLCNGENQDYIKEKYTALWQQIADKFATYDEHLIFESMNEEFNGNYSDPVREQYENINAYNQIFIDTVRASGENNTHRWLMFPGWNTNIDYTVGDYGFQLPTDDKNTAGENRMIVSVHCYDPWDYCGDESKKTFLWGEKGQQIVEINKANPKNKASWGEEEHLENQMKKLKENFIDKGLHVVIGEFGCIDKTSANAGIPNQIAENRAYYNGYLAGIAATYGITPVYWDNGYNGQYGFGLFTRASAEQSQPEIIQAIINAVKNKDPKAGLETKIKRYDDSAGRVSE